MYIVYTFVFMSNKIVSYLILSVGLCVCCLPVLLVILVGSLVYCMDCLPGRSVV